MAQRLLLVAAFCPSPGCTGVAPSFRFVSRRNLCRRYLQLCSVRGGGEPAASYVARNQFSKASLWLTSSGWHVEPGLEGARGDAGKPISRGNLGLDWEMEINEPVWNIEVLCWGGFAHQLDENLLEREEWMISLRFLAWAPGYSDTIYGDLVHDRKISSLSCRGLISLLKRFIVTFAFPLYLVSQTEILCRCAVLGLIPLSFKRL